MRIGRALWLAFVLATLAIASIARATPISPLAQTRFVTVDIDATTTTFDVPPIPPDPPPPSTVETINFLDTEVAGDFGPFSGSAGVPEFPASGATQMSEVTGNRITAVGSHAATSSISTDLGPPFTIFSEVHETESFFSLTFEVDALRPYLLTGSFSAEAGAFASASYRTSFNGPGVDVLAESLVDGLCPTLPDCSSEVILNQAGTLGSGVYTLEARLGGIASTALSPAGEFGGGVLGAFALELVLVPEPSTLLLVGFASLGLCERIRRDRARRTERPPRGRGERCAAPESTLPEAPRAR